MRSGSISLLRILSGFALLILVSSLSWAAPLLQIDERGLCCVHSTLKENTEKQCEKNKGKFYAVKEIVKAQKECHFQPTVTPVESVVSGFCCKNGVVKKTTKEQCFQVRGRYYTRNAAAQQGCQPEEIFCCIDGEIQNLGIDECNKRRGVAYKSAADAEKRCTPAETVRFVAKPRQAGSHHLPSDLSISRFSASPGRIHSGDTVKLTAQVKNVGDRRLPKVTVNYYNMTDNTLLGKNVISIAARSGKQSTFTVPLKGEGRITLLAVVDPDRQIKESNEKNNKKKRVVTVTESVVERKRTVSAQLPDLIPIALKLDRTTAAVGESVTIQVTINNIATKSLSKTIPVAFLLNDTIIATQQTRIPANSTRLLTFDYTVKRAGKHIFSIAIDPENLIAERNEGNNNRTVRLEATSQKVSYHVPGQIILLVDSNKEGRRLLRELTAKYNLQIVRQRVLASLQRLMVVCATEENVHKLNKQLQQEDGLYGSQPNFIFSTMSSGDPLRSMQSIDSLVDLDTIHQKSSGKNVLVAIIDTGVDTGHKDLQNRIKEHANFVDGSAYSGEIHGTAVAGIIAAARNDFGIIGIAPDAELLAYRACKQQQPSQPEGECYSSSIAEAIDAAIAAKARICNLSIGAERNDVLLSTLISEGSRRGMLFVAPVGNDSHTYTVTFPASHPQVIAVAGFDEMNKPVPNKRLTQRADALAPSENIFSSVPDNHYNFVNGTSFSAATITGLMALSLENEHDNSPRKLPISNKAVLWQNQFSAYIEL